MLCISDRHDWFYYLEWVDIMDIYYYLGFSYFLGIGPMRFQLLQKIFKDLKKAYEADRQDLANVLGDKLADKFTDFRRRFRPEKELEIIKNKQIKVITREDALFPTPLIHISDPPICLYVKGKIESYDFEKDFFLGVVGTRMPTLYGQQITRHLVKDLTEQQLIIVSGLALGVDALAHETTLDSQGKTIAILGCGVDIIYPAVNRYLYQRILKNNGLIISEFPPSMPVAKGLFISRNRLISGLSKGVLVVEGSEKSGALITARYAAEQGKDVFAVPAPINSQMSQAPNLLLKQGAKLVTDTTDILEEYGLKKVSRKIQKIAEKLDKKEKAICGLLKTQAYTVNELTVNSQFDLSQVLSILSSLEILGVVTKNNEGKYYLKY